MPKKVILNTSEYYKHGIHNGYYFNTEFVIDFIIKYPREEYDIYDNFMLQTYDFSKEDIPVEVIKNWRFNTYLINYMQSLMEQKIFNWDARGSFYEIIELDEDDSELFDEQQILNSIERQDYYGHNLACFGSEGNEIIKFTNLSKFIIKDLRKMIIDNMTQENINKYINSNNITKYTKNVLLNDKYESEDYESYEY